MRRSPRIGSLVVVGALLAGACGSATTSASAPLSATLSDKQIQLSAKELPAGKVTFTVTNAGTVMHSLVLLKTIQPEDKIPADPKDQSRVMETGRVWSSGPIEAGQKTEYALPELKTGAYVLVCNEPAHYIVGMHVPFTVR